jgi:multiple sugar transport system permease protein
VSSRMRQLTLHALLALGAVVILAPFAWMLSSAFKPEADVFSGSLIPAHPTLANFEAVLERVPLGRYYLNSVLVCAAIFAAQALVCLPAAYALARLRFRGRELSLWLVLACLMIPPQVTAIPIYLLFSRLGMLDSLASLIVPFAGSAFGIFLLRQFILTIPQSLFDAARLDGVGSLAMVRTVVLPLVKPALTSFAIFSVVTHWNDYFWPSVVLRSTDHATIPYGVVQFATVEAGSQYGAQMAAAVLAIAPLIAGFLFAQRQFIQGVALSGLQD